MASIPKRIEERIVGGIKKYQPVLAAAKSRDVGETDTVTIIKDMLADIFGYDKYSELTSEFAIRGTYCDLAIKLENQLTTLIEVKAIGLELKENHVKQAVDYAVNQGVDWVLLTNGCRWCVYHVFFTRPVTTELVVDLDFSNINPKNQNDLDTLYLWCKEGWQKSLLGEFHSRKQALSRYYLGQMVLSDAILQVIRREMRRISPDINITVEQIKSVLVDEVLKREVNEGDKAEEARKKIAKASGVLLRTTKKKDDSSEGQESAPTNEPASESNSEPTANN